MGDEGEANRIGSACGARSSTVVFDGAQRLVELVQAAVHGRHFGDHLAVADGLVDLPLAQRIQLPVKPLQLRFVGGIDGRQ